MVIKVLLWLVIIIIAFFLLMLIIYIAARVLMSGYIDEINKTYKNSFNQLKKEKNDKEETQ